MQGVAQGYGLLHPRFIVPEVRFTGFNLTLAIYRLPFNCSVPALASAAHRCINVRVYLRPSE